MTSKSTLVADIGGTNARFAYSDGQGVRDERILKVADYPGPAEAAKAYIASVKGQKPNIATFAVAGPVTGEDIFRLTNHPWEFSIEATRKALDLENFALINDFHAVALGVLYADPATVTPIGGGTAQKNGNIGVIGPGTGLGVASLIWDGQTKRYIAVPCEGGHVSLPVVHEREFKLISWLLGNRYHHVSAERVCSGKGLVNLYDAIRGVDGLSLPERTPEEIVAHNEKCGACKEALMLMMGFLGRVASNLALTSNTTGGIYFAGGILPKLGISYIENSCLRADFIAKGRYTAYVDQIPTFILIDPFLSLKGLWAYSQ